MVEIRKTALLLAGVMVLCGMKMNSGARRPAGEEKTPQANPDGAAEGSTPQGPLDFETYRSRIEPIFLKKRAGGVRCYDCHAMLPTRLKLEKLSAGSEQWTEEQSRRNFASVAQLVKPSDPLKSPLLLHALAQEAGGDPTHTGGKFWKSQSDPEWQVLAAWVRSGSKAAATEAPESALNPAAAPALDFEFFKSHVEPVFLKERPAHARCYGCHFESNRIFRLEKLVAGNSTWNEEQSRRNFDSAVKQVIAGDPESSRLLMHALAPEAGGDPFHSGGRQFQSQDDPDWLVLAAWVRGSKAAPAPPAPLARVYVTNSAGNTIDVVDPATNKVVQVISGIELPHGVNFSPDGSRVYVSNESESVLDVVDRKSGEIIKKIPLSGRPNNLTITKDGRRVIVGIRFGPAVLDVIDTDSLRLAKSIPVHGNVHNVYVTPDGKYVVSGSLDSHYASVVDLATDQLAWDINLGDGVRPMAFETNPDGSTRRIFVQLSNLHGFAVVDFAKRAEVARMKLPDQPGGFGAAEGRLGTPSHGIGISPDGKTLWVNSSLANAVFAYSVPDLTLIGHATLTEVHPLDGSATGAVPEWITFTPDSKTVYVSNSAARSVSAIDAKTLKEIAVIPVGEVPKRLNTLVLH